MLHYPFTRISPLSLPSPFFRKLCKAGVKLFKLLAEKAVFGAQFSAHGRVLTFLLAHLIKKRTNCILNNPLKLTKWVWCNFSSHFYNVSEFLFFSLSFLFSDFLFFAQIVCKSAWDLLELTKLFLAHFFIYIFGENFSVEPCQEFLCFYMHSLVTKSL